MKTFIITSILPNEGKSTVCKLLAEKLYALNIKTLIIDSDFYKSRMIGMHEGLYEFLTADTNTRLFSYDLGKYFMIYPSKKAIVIGTRYPVKNIESLFQQLSKSYDCILVDTPPLGGLPDALNFAGIADGFILVDSNQKQDHYGIKKLLQRIESTNKPVVGIIKTHVR